MDSSPNFAESADVCDPDLSAMVFVPETGYQELVVQVGTALGQMSSHRLEASGCAPPLGAFGSVHDSLPVALVLRRLYEEGSRSSMFVLR